MLLAFPEELAFLVMDDVATTSCRATRLLYTASRGIRDLLVAWRDSSTYRQQWATVQYQCPKLAPKSLFTHMELLYDADIPEGLILRACAESGITVLDSNVDTIHMLGVFRCVKSGLYKDALRHFTCLRPNDKTFMSMWMLPLLVTREPAQECYRLLNFIVSRLNFHWHPDFLAVCGISLGLALVSNNVLATVSIIRAMQDEEGWETEATRRLVHMMDDPSHPHFEAANLAVRVGCLLLPRDAPLPKQPGVYSPPPTTEVCNQEAFASELGQPLQFDGGDDERLLVCMESTTFLTNTNVCCNSKTHDSWWLVGGRKYHHCHWPTCEDMFVDKTAMFDHWRDHHYNKLEAHPLDFFDDDWDAGDVAIALFGVCSSEINAFK